MKSFKGIAAVFLGILLLCYVVKIHTSASAQAPHWENVPDVSEDFVFWNGTETVKSDTTGQEKIEWMQNALNWCIEHEGLETDAIVVDGKFGPASHRATVAFQEAAGLQQDGCFDSLTIQAMNRVLYDGQSDSLASGIHLQEAASRENTEQTQESLQVSYGSSMKEIPDSYCNCSPDQTCSDCGTVYFFSAVNNLKTAIRKSPVLDTAKDSIVLLFENLLVNN